MHAMYSSTLANQEKERRPCTARWSSFSVLSEKRGNRPASTPPHLRSPPAARSVAYLEKRDGGRGRLLAKKSAFHDLLQPTRLTRRTNEKRPRPRFPLLSPTRAWKPIFPRHD